uniref:Uncharacterized protein n=1 Tax=Anguilla anguilla TaxID=7936 RepID=A0A0E9PS79_ANGAN
MLSLAVKNSLGLLKLLKHINKYNQFQ